MLKALVPVALILAALAVADAGAGGTASVDFGVTLTGPDKAKSKVGAPTTYTVTVTNTGPGTESPHLRLAGGSGATDADSGSGDPVKTLSETPSQGTCKNDGFGVTCRLNDIAPEATATVEVVVVPEEEDVPTLDLQATIEPEKAAVVDTNSANDHVELDTEIPKPIKIEGVPNRCTSKKIVLRIRARVGTLAKQVKLEVDGGVLGSTSKNRLKVAIKEGELEPGSHKLMVIVQSSGPPLATLKDKFKTCEA